VRYLRAPHPQRHGRPEMSAEPRHIASIDVRDTPDTFIDLPYDEAA
jgi:hypothetical protein